MSEEKKAKVDHDTPPFSRLFVICSKNHDEEDIRAAFEEFGNVQDVWLVRDRTNQEKKGICYIKFEKASVAHVAMEKLHGEAIGSDPKPLKVLLADSKGQNRSVAGDAKPRSRIFILISKSASNEEVREEFAQYGTIDHVQIITDKSSGDSKGCAYVKYVHPSEAFTALEECPAKYKAVIAEPRVPRDSRNNMGGGGGIGGGMGGGGGAMGGGGGGMVGGFDARDNISARHMDHSRRRSYSQTYPSAEPQSMESISYTDPTDNGAVQRLYIVCHTSLFEEQLYSLFEVIPGLDSFEMKYFRGSSESRGFAYASYRTVELACYAKRKLDGLEYPPGHRLIVKYAEDKPNARNRQNSSGMEVDSSWNSASVASGAGGGMRDHSRRVVARGSNMLMSTGGPGPGIGGLGVGGLGVGGPGVGAGGPGVGGPGVGGGDCPYTNVPLPKQLPLAGLDTPVRAKLFIVGTPAIPQEDALVDVFCRFASLICIKLIPGTSYGYIHFGTKESAEAATMVLNNCKICGNIVKLSVQEEGNNNENKRSRLSYDGNTQRQWN